jgi:hypothetical protein
LWEEEPDANVGVACGKESNLTVLDVDGEAGRETLRELELENGELPEGPIMLTPSGGCHYYFGYEAGISNAVRFAPGLDIRTEGGLVIGAGSRNAKGWYDWEEMFKLGADGLMPPAMPKWLVEKILAAGLKGESNNGSGGFKASDHPIREGEGRNNYLYRAGRSEKAKLENAGYPEAVIKASVRAHMTACNQEQCNPPLDNDEIEALVANVIKQPDQVGFHAPAVINSSSNGHVPALPPLPAPMKATEWFEHEEKRYAETTYVWEGILEAGGYAMIGGKKGHGKSTFARTLAFAISRGEEFMGRATVQSKVWYLDFEPGGRERIKTLRDLGWCDDDSIEFSIIPPPVNHPDVFDWLRKYIIERGFKVIIVDTLFKLVRIEGSNEYDKGVYAQIPLEEICRDLGVCIIVLHHARKNGQFSSHQTCAEQMLGATSIAGAACACILIAHRGDIYTFRMDPPRYGAAIEGELVLEQDPLGYVTPKGTYKKKWVNMTKQLVMDAAWGIEGANKARKKPRASAATNGQVAPAERDDEEVWFTARDIQNRGIADPETGEPLKMRSIYWALAELVKENLLEKGEPLPASSKGGKPKEQYRVVFIPGVSPPSEAGGPAQKDLF